MIAEPLLAGAVNDTRSDPAAALTAVGLAGLPGTPTTIAFDFAEGAPVPPAFRAATVNW